MANPDQQSAASTGNSAKGLDWRVFSPRAAERLLLVLVMASTLLAFVQCLPLIRFPYQIDFGEGLMLDGAMRILHHQPLYPNPYAFPVILHDWGPVAYAAAMLAMPGGEPSFAAGRVLIVICSVALAVLISVILKHWTGSLWIGLAFGCVLLTLPAFRFWFYLLRTDVIGIVFSTIAVMLYLRDGRRWYWTIPFFGLAIFCKYTLIAASAAVLVHLLLKRKTGQGFGLAAALGSVCVVAFAILQAVTSHWFAFHMFSTHSDRYSLLQFFALAGLVWISAPVLTGLALWHVAHDFRAQNVSFATIYLVTSSITSLSAGQLGSTTNHFLEWMVASCMCAGLAYCELKSGYPKRVVPITVLLGASVLAGVIAQSGSSSEPTRGLVECDRAYESVRNSPSQKVLSQSPGPLLMTGKPVLVSDPFIYSQLVAHGRWPDRHIEQLINEKYFGLIVMADDPSQAKPVDAGGWPEPLLAAIQRNYRIVNRYACRDAAVMLEPVAPAPADGEPAAKQGPLP